MKIILIVCFLLTNVFAKGISSQSKFENYKDAEKSSTYLKFVVESTKIGLFSSDVDGYVLAYTYEADFDSQNKILRNLKLKFRSSDMNTDHEDRDYKLHNLCMSSKKYPEVIITFTGPIFLKEKKQQKLNGKVLIRGKEKPFKAKVKSGLTDTRFELDINTIWSLKEMEIPDPSIAVAKLSDDIKIYTKFKYNLK